MQCLESSVDFCQEAGSIQPHEKKEQNCPLVLGHMASEFLFVEWCGCMVVWPVLICVQL